MPRTTGRCKKLYAERVAGEREFGRLKRERPLPLRARGVEQVRLRADLTILTKLASSLIGFRSAQVPAACGLHSPTSEMVKAA